MYNFLSVTYQFDNRSRYFEIKYFDMWDVMTDKWFVIHFFYICAKLYNKRFTLFNCNFTVFIHIFCISSKLVCDLGKKVICHISLFICVWIRIWMQGQIRIRIWEKLDLDLYMDLGRTRKRVWKKFVIRIWMKSWPGSVIRKFGTWSVIWIQKPNSPNYSLLVN